VKIIKVFREDSEPIELIDNDNTIRSEYVEQLRELMNSTNIMILETSSGSLITRPHKIESILVIDNDELSGKSVCEGTEHSLCEGTDTSVHLDENGQTSDDFIRDT